MFGESSRPRLTGAFFGAFGIDLSSKSLQEVESNPVVTQSSLKRQNFFVEPDTNLDALLDPDYNDYDKDILDEKEEAVEEYKVEESDEEVYEPQPRKRRSGKRSRRYINYDEEDEEEYIPSPRRKRIKHEDSLAESHDLQDGPRYQCDQCDYGTEQSSKMWQHKKAHENPGLVYFCVHCEEGFANDKEYYEHIKKHKGSVYKCPYCERTFSKPGMFRSHVANQHVKEGDIKEENVADLDPMDHMISKEVTQEKRFQCDRCDYGCDVFSLMWHHKKKHDNPGFYHFCNHCEEGFVKESDLEEHLVVHKGAIYKCPHCEKKFTVPGRFRAHVAAHVEREQGSFGDIKLEVFTDIDPMENLAPKNEGRVLKHQCDQCDYGTDVSTRMWQHKKRHEHPGLNFFCHHCEEGFENTPQLNAHLKTHKGAIYKCRHCDQKFTVPGRFRAHVATHDRDQVDVKTAPDVLPKDNLAEGDEVLEKRHSCELCEYETDDGFKFRQHMKAHDNPGLKFFCHHCEEGFARDQDLQDHLKVHKGAKYKCPYCDKKFAVPGRFKLHVSKHEEAKDAIGTALETVADMDPMENLLANPEEYAPKHQCEICGYGTEQAVKMWHHKKRHENPGMRFFCHHCEEGFAKMPELNEHLKIHEGTQYECPQCNKKFSVPGRFRAHMAEHENFQSVYGTESQCVQCGKQFGTRGKLMGHLKHFGPYHTKKCAQCPQEFYNYQSYMEHINIMHGGRYLYICGICDLNFETAADRVVHRKEVHEREVKEKVVCPMCGVQVKNLKLHMVTHEPEQPSPCDICGKVLSHPQKLLSHKRACHGFFPCSECSYIGKNAGNLNLHVKNTHLSNEEKEFHCDICGKGFVERNKLVMHSYIHTGETPFKCEVCGAGFKNRGNKNAHVKAKHLGEKRIKKPKKKNVKEEIHD